MLVLGIESSCDETAAAVVSGSKILSSRTSSQAGLHAPFGGVVPELAARGHVDKIGEVAREALAEAGVGAPELDGIAVTNRPGLAGALLVGLNFAKGLAFALGKPLAGVCHIESHICANYLDSGNPGNGGGIGPPFVSLVASGGHTLLMAVESENTYRLIGSTKDDAAGEAFDKAARALGFPYPGGPEIDRLAELGDAGAVRFPRARVGGLDFSFSGLKTAVLQHVAKHGGGNREDIAASFRQAVVDMLCEKALAACAQENAPRLALAGGVACNMGLRRRLAGACAAAGVQLSIPPPPLCADNAAMVAARGALALAAGRRDGLGLNAHPGRLGRAAG